MSKVIVHCSRAAIMGAVNRELRGDASWLAKVRRAPRVHIAVMAEPFLALVLRGAKTVETRFSDRRTPPYDAAQAGDLVLFKRVSGPVVGMATLGGAQSMPLNPGTWSAVRSLAAEIGADAEFWRQR